MHQSNDAEVLRSLLRMNDMKASMPLLRILITRLRFQENGTIPMDKGPLQHAVCHAVLTRPTSAPPTSGIGRVPAGKSPATGTYQSSALLRNGEQRSALK